MSHDCMYHQLDTTGDEWRNLWEGIMQQLAKIAEVDTDGGRLCPVCLLQLLATPNPDVAKWAKNYLAIYTEYKKLGGNLGI